MLQVAGSSVLSSMGADGTAGPARLTRFGDCDDMGSWMRGRALESVGSQGIGAYRGPTSNSSGSNASGPASLPTTGPDTSSTNTQEAGIDEPAPIKVTPDWALVANGSKIVRVALADGSPRADGELELGGTGAVNLLVVGTRAIVLRQSFNGPSLDAGEAEVLLRRDREAKAATTTTAGQRPSEPSTGLPGTELFLVDLSGPMTMLDHVTIQGRLIGARLVGTRALVATSASPAAGRFIDGRGVPSEEFAIETNKRIATGLRPDNWLPAVRRDTASGSTEPLLSCDRVFRPSEFAGFSMLSTSQLDLSAPPTRFDFGGTIAVVTSADAMYSSANHLVVTSERWLTSPSNRRSDQSNTSGDAAGTYTLIHTFDISQTSRPRFLASASVPGRIVDPFSISELGANLRVVTVRKTGATYDHRTFGLSILAIKPDALELVGRLDNLGSSDFAGAVRFVGTVAVVSTNTSSGVWFVDLSNPAAPRQTGKVAIAGSSRYLHPLSPTSLLALGVDVSTGQMTFATASVIDMSNPAVPTQASSLQIAGAVFSTDYQAFVWWPATGSVLVPVSVYGANNTSSAGLAVLDNAPGGIRERGRISHPPRVTSSGDYQKRIEAVAVVGRSIVTVSLNRVQTNDLATLQEIGYLDLQ